MQDLTSTSNELLVLGRTGLISDVAIVGSESLDLQQFYQGNTQEEIIFKDVIFRGIKIINLGSNGRNDIVKKYIFDHCVFEEDVSMHNSSFERKVIFKNMSFNKKFEIRCNFHSGFLFQNVIFNDEIKLFHQNVSNENYKELNGFKDCEFNNRLVFGTGDYRCDFTFWDCRFKGNSIFESTIFHSNLIFIKNTFYEPIEFRDSVAYYGSVRFENNIYKPLFENKIESYEFFVKLKEFASKFGFVQNFYKFYSLEQRAKKGKNLLSNIYYWISDYGNSIWWPICWMLGLLVIFAVLYDFTQLVEYKDSLNNWHQVGCDLKGFWNSAAIQFKGIIRPLYKIDYIRIKKGWPVLLFILNTFAHITLIGFIAVAIRRKFKSKL